MSNETDVGAYCNRIRYDGEVSPTLDILNAIVQHHTRSVPFENLDVLLGRPINLSIEALRRKIVHERRGGYCFEQNGLLLHVLETIGFRVRPLSARVRLTNPRGNPQPRTHVFLEVTVDEVPWLTDVGIGAFSPTAPIRMDINREQATSHEPRRIVREEGLYFHQVLIGEKWQDVYEFTMEEMPLVDRELSNWFTSTHPLSPFRKRLMVARADHDGIRISLQDGELTRRHGAEVLGVQKITHADELLDALYSQFGLSFPKGTRFGVACE
jgi:N-hydroxyarylamine O-acetyltransferase